MQTLFFFGRRAPQDYEAALDALPGQPATLLAKAKAHLALRQREVGAGRAGLAAARPPLAAAAATAAAARLHHTPAPP